MRVHPLAQAFRPVDEGVRVGGVMALTRADVGPAVRLKSLLPGLERDQVGREREGLVIRVERPYSAALLLWYSVLTRRAVSLATTPPMTLSLHDDGFQDWLLACS
jgi:hypothetical protein